MKSIVLGDPRPAVAIDAVVAPLVATYQTDASARGVTVTQEAIDALRVVKLEPSLDGFSNINEDSLAYCVPMTGTDALGNIYSWKEIHILQPSVSPLEAEDQSYSASGDNLDFKSIVYHELTHCLLNKGHNPNGFTDIMAADYVPLVDAPGLWEGQIDELFSSAYQALLPSAF